MRSIVVLFTLLVFIVPARAELGSGSVASLLDPDKHLTLAKGKFDSGDATSAARHLQVALELAPVGTPSWLAAHQLAMEKRPDLFARTFAGANFDVPLALVPEDDSLYAPDEVFTIPPYGPHLAFVDKDSRETIRFHLKNGRPLDAAHVVENFIAVQKNHLSGLMLAAILYERFGQLALAEARWTEVAHKARGVDSQARFAALFGIFRTKYRRQDFKVAELLLEKYVQEAQAYLADVLEKFRNSNGNKDDLYWLVLEGRRHLVEGFDALGVVKSFRKNNVEALYHFEQAALLVPGSIVVALNHVQALQKLMHSGTARQIHAKLAEALTALERALLARLDRQIDEGALDLGTSLTFRDLLRNMVARVRVRQALFEKATGETKTPRGLLREALNLADRFALAHYYMGIEQKAADELDDALVRFKRAMQLAPESKLKAEAKKRIDEVFELQAMRAQWTRTRTDQLKDHFEQKLDPEPLQIFRRDLAEGVRMLESAEFAKAREHFLRLSEYHKDSVDLFRWLGFANQELARYKEALVAYDRALAIDPVDPWSLSQKAICMYEYVSDLPNALRLAGEAARIKGDDAGILSNLGWLHAMAGELRQGIGMLFEAIERSPKDPRHHYRLGMAYYNLGIYPFAAAKFRDTLAIYPKHVRAAVFLGLAEARVGKVSEAITHLSKSLELIRDNPDLTGMVTQNLALLKGGNTNATAPGPKGSPASRLPLTADEIVRARGAQAALAQARTLVLRGELAPAKELLASAHKDFPTAVELALGYGTLLLTTRQETDQKLAREVLSTILDLNSQEIRALHLFAHVQFQQGAVGEFVDGLLKFHRLPPGLVLSEFVEAIAKRWLEVLDIDKNDTSAVDACGLVELLAGRLDAACDVLSRSKTPEGKRLLGEVYLRQFFVDRKQLTFQQAKQALTEGGYAQLDQLDRVWKQVMEPGVAPAEQVAATPPPLQPAKDLEGWWRLSSDTKKLSFDNMGRVDRIDMNNTLVHSRRWSQIDQSMRRKVERFEAAKNREVVTREQEAKEEREKAEQERIRSNFGGPEKPKTVGPPARGLPRPNGALVVGEQKEPPRNQLKNLAAKHLADGLELVASGRLANAVREFKAAVNLDPAREELLVTLALALTIGGEGVKASSFLTSRRRLVNSLSAWLMVGHVAWQEGRIDEAERAFVQAVSRLVRESPGSVQRPRRDSRKGHETSRELAYLTVSRKAWQETLLDNPSDPDANMNVALLDFFAGRALAAQTRLEKLWRTPDGALAYAEVAFFRSLAKPNPAALRKAIEVLGSVGGGARLVEVRRALLDRMTVSR